MIRRGEFGSGSGPAQRQGVPSLRAGPVTPKVPLADKADVKQPREPARKGRIHFAPLDELNKGPMSDNLYLLFAWGHADD